jgi:hypothetical protein
MVEGALVLSGLLLIAGKPMRAAFDGRRLTSDAGVLVLAEIEGSVALSSGLEAGRSGAPAATPSESTVHD